MLISSMRVFLISFEADNQELQISIIQPTSQRQKAMVANLTQLEQAAERVF